MTTLLFANEWIFLLVVSAILLGLAELGYRFGLRKNATALEALRSLVSGVRGAVLGLLGLLLGFTFAMGVDRYETRRELVTKEANAIGTAWLRAGLLPEAHRGPVREMFRNYVELRLKYQALSRDSITFAEGLRLCAELQDQLWSQAETAAAEAPGPLTVSFITSLNEVIDTGGERLAAGRNKIPGPVWVLLIVVAGFGCFTSGYGSGVYGMRSILTNVLLPLLITIVIYLIFDLTHSLQGFIGVSQQPLIDLLQSMRPK